MTGAGAADRPGAAAPADAGPPGAEMGPPGTGPPGAGTGPPGTGTGTAPPGTGTSPPGTGTDPSGTGPPDPDPPGTGTERPALAHVPALDGLRGLAVAAVVAFHADRLPGGWLGVDAFFVLSGYLITSLLLVDRARTGAVRLGRFWSRRVRRLGPALVLTVLATSVQVALLTDAARRERFRGDALAALFEVMNWRTIATQGDYWSQYLPPSPLQHAWSLSIEEQVYVLWPLVVVAVLALARRPLAVAVTALAGAAASALALGVLAGGDAASITRLYMGTDTRVAAVLLGAAVAGLRLHLGPRRWRASGPARIVAGSVAVVPLLYLWVRLDGSRLDTYRGPLTLASVLATVVLASIVDRADGGPLGRLLSLRPLTYLGEISYGLYLYHWPIFVLVDERPERLTAIEAVVATAAAVGVAAASHRWIELPVRRGALRGRRARAAVPAAVALSVLAILVATLDAHPRGTHWDDYLFESSVPGAPTVVYAGDSLPLLLGEAAVGQVDELGVNVGSVAVPGCNLLDGVGPIRDIAGEIWDGMGCGEPGRFRAGTEAYRPTVSLVLFGRIHDNAVRIDGTWRLPCEPDYMRIYRQRLDAMIDDLRSTGGAVVLVSSPGSTVSWVVEASPPGMAERVACLNDLLAEVAEARPGVGFVDLARYICPTPDRCLDRIDGVDLRPDTVHFEGESARLVNRWLIPRALDAARDG